MQHGVVPVQVEKLEHLLHPLLGMEHELFVRHPETAGRTQLAALIVHRLHRPVPLLHALPVAGQVEARDGHLAGDDAVGGGAAVAHHEDELGVGEQVDDVRAHFDGQGVLVAETGRRLAVLGDYFEGEGRDGRVQDFFGDAGLFQSHGLLLGLEPVEAELEEARDHPSLLAASGTKERCSFGVLNL